MFEEKFIIAENPVSMPGPGLIISTDPPFWVGKVVQFKTVEEYHRFLSSPLGFYKCKGYRIIIIEIGALNLTEKFEFYRQPFIEMADFYLHNKILKNERHYQKYKD